MFKRVNIAMLSQSTQDQQVVIDENNEALATDQDAAQIQQQDAEIDEIQGVVQETQDAADCICQTAEKIDKMPQVSQEVVQIAQEQIAYFAKRTGMKMSGVSAAMESYSAGKAGNKEALVKQMNLAVESLEKGIDVAQEGIVDRVKDAFSVMFTSYDKLGKELEVVSKEFDEKGPKEEVIKDSAFARILNPEGKSEIKSSDVVSFLDAAVKEFDDTSVIKGVRQLNEYLAEAKTITKESKTFWTDKEAIAKFEELLVKMDELVDGIEEEISPVASKSDADIEPLNAADKAKLVKKVQGILDTGNEYGKTLKEYNKYSILMMGIGKVRLFGDMSAEGRIYTKVKYMSFKTYRKLAKLAKLRFEVAHACVKYIKASTAR